MRVWRIANPQYAVLNGEGARRFGGRWNDPGYPAIYTSIHLSLAAMEVRVHIPQLTQAPRHHVAYEIDIPDSLSLMSLFAWMQELGISDYEGRETEIGTAWLHQQTSVGLIVPSAVVPQEQNVLLNPLHPEMQQIRVVDAFPFQFDPRLW